MNTHKTVSGIVALIATLAIAQSVSGADVLLPPSAAARQTHQVSGIGNDRDLVHGAAQNIFQSPRAMASQTRVVPGTSTKDKDYVHSQSPSRPGKDQLRDQYSRFQKTTGNDTIQLAPVK